MREILFRGKRKDNGKWIEGNGIDTNFFLDVAIIVGYCDETTGSCECDEYVVIPETVGQYTGLTDKNGTKIFEGDIVKADGYIFVVKFGKCGGVANAENYGYMGFYFGGFDKITKDCIGYGLRNDMCYFTEREVIGNIHDNPELMKVGNE